MSQISYFEIHVALGIFDIWVVIDYYMYMYQFIIQFRFYSVPNICSLHDVSWITHDISFDNHKFAALGMVRKSSVSSLMAERKGHVDALEIGLWHCVAFWRGNCVGWLCWTGMEVASALAGSAATVSVVDIIKVPFQLVLGEKVGTVLQKVTLLLLAECCYGYWVIIPETRSV